MNLKFKKMKKKLNLLIILAAAMMLVSQGCQDLEVENLMEPDRERALANPAQLLDLLNGGYSTMFNISNHRSNQTFDGYSDQVTGTNAYYGWWSMMWEPKFRITNTTTWSDKTLIESPWEQYNSMVSTANSIIAAVVIDGMEIVDDQGEDQTDKALASAYFLRGVGQAYLAMIFDKAYVVNEDTDLSALEFNTPAELMDAAINSYQKAREVAQAADFTWDMLRSNLTTSEFIQLVNSYEARSRISLARNSTQAAAYDWATILSLAEAGIDFDWFVVTTQDQYSVWHLVMSYTVNGGAGHYQHTDIKVMNLFDPTYPIRYPDAGSLPPAVSDDARLEAWWVYDDDFGFMRESRGRYLFSNYAFLRWSAAEYDAGTREGLDTPFFLKAENDLIKAEALVALGRNAEAKAILDDPANARAVNGGLGPLADDSNATLMHAIYYETCIELFAAAKGVQFFGMRRWDLLQIGTPLHFPIPASELETTGDEVYTFGGNAFADGEGTALGTTSWDTNPPF